MLKEEESSPTPPPYFEWSSLQILTAVRVHCSLFSFPVKTVKGHGPSRSSIDRLLPQLTHGSILTVKEGKLMVCWLIPGSDGFGGISQLAVFIGTFELKNPALIIHPKLLPAIERGVVNVEALSCVRSAHARVILQENAVPFDQLDAAAPHDLPLRVLHIPLPDPEIELTVR